MPPGADCHYPDVALSLVDAKLTLPFCALNQNLFLIRSSSFPQTAPIVKTRFDLNPEQEWIQAHKARTINLKNAGEKASLNLGQRYWIIALEGKSYTHISVQKVSSNMP